MNRIVVQPDPRRKRVLVQVDAPGAERILLEMPDVGLRAEGAPGAHSLVLSDFTPWTPSTPHLYSLRCHIDGAAATDLKIGIREVSVQEQRFTVNQRPVVLRGVRRPGLEAKSIEAIRRDVNTLKEAGFNWIACTANQPDVDTLLDVTDAAGVLVSIELEHLRNTSELAEFVRRFHHHPSMLFWKLDECDPHFLALREQDPLRPILVCGGEGGSIRLYRPFQADPERLEPVDIETFSPVSRETESFFTHLGHATTTNLVSIRGFAPPPATAGDLATHQADGLRLAAEHLRTNPRVAGYCIEDALVGDLATCVPQLNALREAQAAVRPVISLARTNLVPREEVEVTVLLLNEAKLEGRAEMSLQVVGPTNQTLWKKKRGVKIPKHGKELWTGSVAASGSTGPHRFVVQVWTDQGLVAEGSAGFHVSPAVEAWKGALDVLDPANRWLETVRRLAPRIEPTAQVILVPPLATSVRAYPDNLFGQMLGRVREGAVAIVCDPPHDWAALVNTLSSPVEAVTKHFLGDGTSGVAVMGRLHPVFEGLPAGGPLGRPYRGVLTQRYIAGETDDDIAPVQRWDAATETGAVVAVRRFGNGRIVFTTARLLDRLGQDPVADRLFINLLHYSERRALPFAGIARAEMKTVEWVRHERGKLRTWRVIGPFPNTDGTGHTTAYPPEGGFEAEATYAGAFRAASWTSWHQGPDKLDELDLAAAIAPRAFVASPLAGTYYAYAEINGDSRSEPRLKFRHSGASKCWLNGRLTYDSAAAATMDDAGGEFKGNVVLKQGRNTLLVKISVVRARPWFETTLSADGLPMAWR